MSVVSCTVGRVGWTIFALLNSPYRGTQSCPSTAIHGSSIAFSHFSHPPNSKHMPPQAYFWRKSAAARSSSFAFFTVWKFCCVSSENKRTYTLVKRIFYSWPNLHYRWPRNKERSFSRMIRHNLLHVIATFMWRGSWRVRPQTVRSTQIIISPPRGSR